MAGYQDPRVKSVMYLSSLVIFNQNIVFDHIQSLEARVFSFALHYCPNTMNIVGMYRTVLSFLRCTLSTLSVQNGSTLHKISLVFAGYYSPVLTI